MLLSEVINQTPYKELLSALIQPLQDDLNAKGANIAKVAYKNGPFFGRGSHEGEHLHVKFANTQALTRDAVWNVVDSFVDNATGILPPGLRLGSSGSRSGLCIFIIKDKNVKEALNLGNHELAWKMGERTATLAKQLGKEMKLDHLMHGNFWRDVVLGRLRTGGAELQLYSNVDYVSDTMFETAYHRLLELMDEEGYLDSMLPVEVTHIANASVGLLHIFFRAHD